MHSAVAFWSRLGNIAAIKQVSRYNVRFAHCQQRCHTFLAPSLSRSYASNPPTEKPRNGAKSGRTSRTSRTSKIAGIAVFAGLSLVAYQYLGTPEQKIFDPPRFTPFKIVNREDVSPTCIILTLRPQNASNNELSTDPYASWWQKGTWSVEVKQPQLQIARAYTPLPPQEGDKTGDLRFLIRKERNGEVSGYLHRIPVGGTVEMRGPNTELELDADLKEVVFLAGGTSIAPAMQVAHTLLGRSNDTDKPKVRVIWANKKREDCIGGVSDSTRVTASAGQIVKELAALQARYPNNMSVEYVVDEEKTLLDKRKIVQTTSLAAQGDTATRLLIVSGPEGFITHFAGKKLWDGGQDGQGIVGGVIGSIGLKDWRVWKM